jgi:hypothetical protein
MQYEEQRLGYDIHFFPLKLTSLSLNMLEVPLNDWHYNLMRLPPVCFYMLVFEMHGCKTKQFTILLPRLTLYIG